MIALTVLSYILFLIAVIASAAQDYHPQEERF